jgi:TldD protein
MATREQVRQAVDAARGAGARYADARFVRRREQHLRVREAKLVGLTDEESEGIGIRVLVDGVWGFAATPRMTVDDIARAARDAVAVARANRRLRGRPVELAPAPAIDDTWMTPMAKDPFRVSLKRKVDLLLGASRAALAVPGVKFASAQLAFVREEKLFASTDGSVIEQTLVRTWPQMSVTAVDDSGDFQVRTIDTPPASLGYEHVEAADLIGQAPRTAEEALRKLRAKSVDPGVYDMILHPTNLWLTVHESIGHPTELDRALGYEANFAGTSYATPEKRGHLKIGSPIVNLFADRTQPSGLATCGFDDDGVQTGRWDLVKNGLFVGYQTTREQAGWIGERASRGCSYADSWASVPFQRMPNVSLQPGEKRLSLDELIGSTRRAIYIEGTGSWSIDHQRYNFQFSGGSFWLVQGGKKVAPLRDVAYQSNSLDFWRSCDAICDSRFYQLGGSFYDGKGEPGQSNSVSHGCAPARFHKVNILNTRAKGGPAQRRAG